MIIPAQFPMYAFERTEGTDTYEEFVGVVVAWQVSETAEGVPFVEAGLTAGGDVVYTGDSGYEMRAERPA
jgi:hypothetical protein